MTNEKLPPEHLAYREVYYRRCFLVLDVDYAREIFFNHFANDCR